MQTLPPWLAQLVRLQQDTLPGHELPAATGSGSGTPVVSGMQSTSQGRVVRAWICRVMCLK